MKFAELKNKDPEQLQQVLNDLRAEQFKSRMQHGTGQLTNTAAMRQLRRDIARVKTLQTQLSAQQSAPGSADGEQA
ncbi:MAG: 50S ribosomal protein L29 [Gammaproteobacteria bacterium]|jgi:large subunit ribosomal protein L29|nr:50S ribosomal protein L29 [Gammaproteobacteria bacterium]